MFIVMFVLVAIASLYLNVNAGRGSEWVAGGKPSFIIKTTLGNHGSTPTNFDSVETNVSKTLNTIMIITILISSIFLRRA